MSASTDNRVYLEWLRAWTEEDKKVLLLLIGFDLAIVSLVLSEKLFSAQPKSALVACAVVSFLASAGFLYQYYHALHMALRGLLPSVLSDSISDVEQLFADVWKRNRGWFRLGHFFLGLGLLLLLLAYVRLIAS